MPSAYAATAPADARLVYITGACQLNASGSTAAVGEQLMEIEAKRRRALTDSSPQRFRCFAVGRQRS
jgi:hypothetical protein